MNNTYSALLDILLHPREEQPGVLLGTLTGISPLSVRLDDTIISRDLFCSRDFTFEEEDIGRELALFPCESGLLILFFVKEVDA